MPVKRTVILEPENVAIILHPKEGPIYVGPGTSSDEPYSATVMGRALYNLAADQTGQTTIESAIIGVLRDDGAGEEAVSAIMSAFSKNFDAIFDGKK